MPGLLRGGDLEGSLHLIITVDLTFLFFSFLEGCRRFMKTDNF